MVKKRVASLRGITSPVSEPDWRAQSDMETLKRHAEIKADPKRHAAAAALATKEVESLKKIDKPRITRRK